MLAPCVSRQNMTVVGVTGPQHLTNGESWHWVLMQLRAAVAQLPPPLLGVSSLAIGADQLFAQVVLEAGGTIKAVIPFDSYDRTFKGDDCVRYARLRNLVASVEELPRIGSDEQCYFAAGKRVVDLSSLMIAIWNDKAAAGLGRTAEIVHYATAAGKPVIHINPLEGTVTRK